LLAAVRMEDLRGGVDRTMAWRNSVKRKFLEGAVEGDLAKALVISVVNDIEEVVLDDNMSQRSNRAVGWNQFK